MALWIIEICDIFALFFFAFAFLEKAVLIGVLSNLLLFRFVLLLQAFLHPEGADHMRDIVVTETLEDIDKVRVLTT